MIRKIFLSLAFTFMLLWFVAAHITKNKVSELFTDINSDNITISYKDIRVLGFPFNLQVQITEPKITIIDNNTHREISANKGMFTFAYNLEFSDLNLGKELTYKDIHNNKTTTYLINSDQDYKISFNFKQLLLPWQQDKILNLISATSFNNDLIRIKQDNGQIFDLKNIIVFVDKLKTSNNIDDFHIKIAGKYQQSTNKHFTANLSLELDYISNNTLEITEEDTDYNHKIKISQGTLTFDKSSLDLKGVLEFNEDSIPKGELLVSLIKYPKVLDNLIPKNFIIPKSYMRQLIIKASGNKMIKTNQTENISFVEDVNFTIKFSDEGIKIGKLNLLQNKVK
ncbi:MAG: DUF2125 domain-containing protein [Rickettsiaceae bacterium]|nr:DUF2125 domain-containing protein [Rickettsiaceae bacterium]